MNILEYVLENEEKVARAIKGTLSRSRTLVGGVGDNAEPEAILAEYDRLGGLITKGGVKIKTGSFYDVKAKKPREIPELSFMAEVDGEIVEVTEEEAKAVKKAKKKTAEIKAKKAKKLKK